MATGSASPFIGMTSINTSGLLVQAVLDQWGRRSKGGTSGSGASAPSATATPSGPGAVASLDTLYVADGDVIRASDHNMLVDAVRLLATLIDTGEISDRVTVSAAPLLQPVVGAGKTPFAIDEGFARGPANDPQTITGWMPLDLPDGYSIESVRVLGSYPGTSVADWPVSLRRVQLGKEGDETLISGKLNPAAAALGTAFSQSFAFDPRGHSRAEADALARVDTTKYRYQFHTTVLQAKPSADLKVFTVQVTCLRGSS